MLRSFLNILSIRYDTAKPPQTLIDETAIALQPSTLVADPVSVEAMRTPPRITTPLRLLLVLIKGENRAGSTAQIRYDPRNPAKIKYNNWFTNDVGAKKPSTIKKAVQKMRATTSPTVVMSKIRLVKKEAFFYF